MKRRKGKKKRRKQKRKRRQNGTAGQGWDLGLTAVY